MKTVRQGPFMQRNLRPWVTTGVVLVGASLIAVTPLTAPLPDVQHRQFRLVDFDEFDLSQLTATTEANWSGLETAVSSSSNWTTDPDISQGLSTLFSDLSTGTANPVTNPTALLTEGALLLTSSANTSNAASAAANGRHGQRRIGAERRRLLRGAHRPGKRAHHGFGRLPQRLPGNRQLRRADFPGSGCSPTPPTARPPARSTPLRRSATPWPTRLRTSAERI